MALIRLPVDVRSVAAARGILRDALRPDGEQRGPGSRDDAVGSAVLMVSELVTNAVLHTRDVLLLEITIRGGTLRVAVADDGPGTPVVHAEDHRAAHGRGLGIVTALADRWGAAAGAGRKSVWFELELPPAAPSRAW